MIRKAVFFIPVFFLCLGLVRCKSPEEPEEPNYEFRYNVQVIYTRIADIHAESQDAINLNYQLYDPIQVPHLDEGDIEMDKIGKNKYRCYLPKVWIQTQAPEDWYKYHKVKVTTSPILWTGENIDIQGAYELVIHEIALGSWFWFKMSKD